MNKNYQLGLLYLVKLLIDADGIADEKELEALRLIKKHEQISDDVFLEFEDALQQFNERKVYETGITLINACSQEEKLKVFATLYRLSEADGRVHVKEIKLLLYSIKTAGMEFDDVVNYARSLPSIF
ncbi:tellurite resistance TerB family protein [Ohtaekwangia koreensis]|uniref:Tellurite resistance protein TerB n=1 Tax=Ohtaekwangia koreensis TaxID=688867 RepID=A0A1T5LJB9_9BACT|nr:TerB family tellurite resistance protein [Ohtaekwangia koreensis]SKC76061.1 Tellurite resistance protein TerB [Ohtaekwangia koreensis]